MSEEFLATISGTVSPVTFLGLFKTEDAVTSSFLNVSENSQFGRTYCTRRHNLNINFVWICHVWWNLREEVLDHTQWRTRL